MGAVAKEAANMFAKVWKRGACIQCCVVCLEETVARGFAYTCPGG